MSHDVTLVIHILQWIRKQGGCYVNEVAEEFDIPLATVKRLLQTTPLTGHGIGGGELLDVFIDEDDDWVSVKDLHYLSPLVRLDRVQATALLAGLSALETTVDPSQLVELHDLMAKIRQSAESVGAPIEIVPLVTNSDILDTMRQAIHDRSCVEMEYISGDQRVTSRIIEPQSITHQDGLTYVNSWCQTSESGRTFRLDRMMSAKLCDAPSTNSHHVKVESNFLGDIEVIIRATPQGLEQFHPSCITSRTELPDGRIEARVMIGSLNWITGVAMASAGRIEIYAPQEARDLLQQRIHAWREHNPS